MNAAAIIIAAFHVLCDEDNLPGDARDEGVFDDGEAEEWLAKIASGECWLSTYYNYAQGTWSPALGGY